MFVYHMSQLCEVLYMLHVAVQRYDVLCFSGFVDDVIFHIMGILRFNADIAATVPIFVVRLDMAIYSI